MDQTFVLATTAIICAAILGVAFVMGLMCLSEFSVHEPTRRWISNEGANWRTELANWRGELRAWRRNAGKGQPSD
jgi:hypothetical protein